MGVKENRTVTKDGITLPYTQSRRKTSRITIRVTGDGRVTVSAPVRASLREIHGVIEKNFEKILSALSESTPPRPLAEGAVVFYLGDAYRLSVATGKPSLTFSDGVARLCVSSPSQALDLAYEKECRKLFLALITERCLAFEAQHPAFAEKRKEIRVRQMKSVWGNCRPEQGILTFSTHLLRHAVPLIDGVIAHEYVHFLHRGHGTDFYRTLSCVSPDYQALKRDLDAQHRAQRKEMAK